MLIVWLAATVIWLTTKEAEGMATTNIASKWGCKKSINALW